MLVVSDRGVDPFIADRGALAQVGHGRPLIGGDIPRVDDLFPALRFGDQEFGKLRSVTGDHIEADIVELLFDIRRIGGGGEFGFKVPAVKYKRICLPRWEAKPQRKLPVGI